MFKHMLLAVDGSELSEATYRKAIALAQAMHASITAVQVVTHYDVLRLQSAMRREVAERYMKEVYGHAEAYLARIAEESAAAGVMCETTCVTRDHVYEAIIDTAGARGCDLIVMASHGRRGVQALVLGSETHKVLTHSKIPVLVYR
ncbi:universal stress protein [Cupriavidus sp. UYPR2.512]|uniref:universal stress protein n=1 Tax=Cupriavidus sp. UYPR2.512 TaxID=1080187 RepID=UPI0003686D7E|nr:universal stress protein [Cupriavidus sp. UYPR2.512]UIF86481.1 universal stress protein [Cupriavidus necator]